MKKGLICIFILLTTVLVIFGVYQTTNKNHYDYQGYITDIYENEKGETVIVALSGTKESTFTVKWYSKMYTPVEKIFKNNRVMLSPTFFSDTNFKKATTKIGYFTEG